MPTSKWRPEKTYTVCDAGGQYKRIPNYTQDALFEQQQMMTQQPKNLEVPHFLGVYGLLLYNSYGRKPPVKFLCHTALM